jgi:hypothetical protein
MNSAWGQARDFAKLTEGAAGVALEEIEKLEIDVVENDSSGPPGHARILRDRG